MLSWDQLHDATLLGIELDWKTGRVVLRLRVAQSEVQIVGVTARRVDCPRQQPWGPSISINKATVGGGLLELEMQSGDVIRIEADRFEIG